MIFFNHIIRKTRLKQIKNKYSPRITLSEPLYELHNRLVCLRAYKTHVSSLIPAKHRQWQGFDVPVMTTMDKVTP
jgi:hypothetical protein